MQGVVRFESLGKLTGLCMAATTVMAMSVARAEVQLGIEVGGGYSDNIQRVNSGETDEKIGTVGLDLTWQEQNRRLDADVLVDVSYFDYLDDTYDSEVVGIADGTVTLALVPERFSWVFQDTFGQAQTDPFAPVTPENRENVNYFTTGPDFILRLGSVSSLQLFGRYSGTDYEQSALDAQRSTAGAALARQPSPRTEVALNAVTDSTDFDAPESPDYDRDSAFFSYSVDGSRTDLDARLGYSWLKSDGGSRNGGLLINLALSRDVSASSTLHLELGRQFTDAGEVLRTTVGNDVVGGADISSSADPFENTLVSVRWSFIRDRTGLDLGASWSEDRYQQRTALDRTRIAYAATFTRQITQKLDLSLSAIMNDEEFDTSGLQFNELHAVARLSWQAGRTLGFALWVDRSERTTSIDLGEYTENRAFFGLTFTPLGAARVAR